MLWMCTNTVAVWIQKQIVAHFVMHGNCQQPLPAAPVLAAFVDQPLNQSVVCALVLTPLLLVCQGHLLLAVRLLLAVLELLLRAPDRHCHSAVALPALLSLLQLLLLGLPSLGRGAKASDALHLVLSLGLYVY